MCKEKIFQFSVISVKRDVKHQERGISSYLRGITTVEDIFNTVQKNPSVVISFTILVLS